MEDNYEITKIMKLLDLDEDYVSENFSDLQWILKHDVKDWNNYLEIKETSKITGLSNGEIADRFFNYYEFILKFNLTLSKLKQCELYADIQSQPLVIVCMEHEKFLSQYTKKYEMVA